MNRLSRLEQKGIKKPPTIRPGYTLKNYILDWLTIKRVPFLTAIFALLSVNSLLTPIGKVFSITAFSSGYFRPDRKTPSALSESAKTESLPFPFDIFNVSFVIEVTNTLSPTNTDFPKP